MCVIDGLNLAQPHRLLFMSVPILMIWHLHASTRVWKKQTDTFGLQAATSTPTTTLCLKIVMYICRHKLPADYKAVLPSKNPKSKVD